jgi:hypothetical protein
MLRKAVLALGGLAVIVASFVGTLHIMDRWGPPTGPDAERVLHVRDIKSALEKYRSAKGRYPSPFPDNPLTDIGKELGLIVPKDPDWGVGEKQYRYVSPDGKRYGLLIHLHTGAPCLTGVGAAGTGWWQNAPPCSF